MSTLIEQANGARYLYTDGTNLFKSVNATKYEELFAVNRNITNVQVTKIDDYYYFIGSLGMSRTRDFINYDDIDVSLINDSSYTAIDNLRLFQDENNKWHISYQAVKDTLTGIYLADFDVFSNEISNAYQVVKVSTENYHPHIIYLNKKYFIFCDNSFIYVSDSMLSGYSELATNITNLDTDSYSSPFLMVAGDYLYLYQLKNGSEMTYRVARTVNPIAWSNETTVDGVIGAGGFYYDSAVYTEYPTFSDSLETFDPIVLVKALHVTQKAVLTCFLWDTFEVQWSENSSLQVTFTAFDDGSVSYDMVQTESSIFWNGQEYIIKNCEVDYSKNVQTKQVTATHIYNELQYVRQRNSSSDTLTYTIKEVLDYYLSSSNDDTNTWGFTYNVYGDFTKQQISSMGGNSAKDMLSTIISNWTNAIIFPDNRVINIYTPATFEKNYGRRIDYLNNAQSIKMTIDSSNLVNRVYCIGKTYENSDDSSDTEYYFDPFFTSDEDSIKAWGLHQGATINDERFTDAGSMKTYATNQLVTQPSISLEVTDFSNNVPIAGEVRHLKVNSDYEDDVMLIGYTWYPFSKANPTVLEFDNLPASILNTQAIINNRVLTVQEMVQNALNKVNTATTNYISNADPTTYTTVSTGDIWTRKLEDNND